jgi:hypothetical protein
VKRFVQLTIFGLCLAFSVATVYNVFSDNAAVERMAGFVACDHSGAANAAGAQVAGDAACRPHITRLERTPFGQSFEFVTSKRTVAVRCERAFVLAGKYICKVQ